MQTPVEPATIAKRSLTNRSRVSNGSDLLPGIDGRSATARRYRDIVAAVVADMGGVERCSEARLQLIRRFAAAACMAEAMEARLVNGETVDMAEHSLLSSTLVRLAQRIGINRLPKDVTPTLADIARYGERYWRRHH